MTTISNVGSAMGPPPMDRNEMRQRMDKVFSAVADKLGMSVDDLKADLRKGQSLTDVAASKGMSKDDLLATIKSVMSADQPTGSAPAGAPSLDDVATRIADHKGGGHHHHHHHADATSSTTTVSPGASTNPLLGTNVDEIL